jgi:diguanylate cyclase (GGDEF)-like protein/PAS domain S-box-containing protein
VARKPTYEDLEQRIRLLEEAIKGKRTKQEMATLADIGRLIGSTLNIDEVYERFAAETQKLIRFESLTINLYNFQENSLCVAYVSGLDIDGRRQGDPLVLEGSLSEAVIRSRTSQLIQPTSIDGILGHFPRLTPIFQAGLRSIICVPLVYRNEAIGVLHFRSMKPNAYTKRDFRLAERIGDQIAGAIANAQLFADLKNTERSLRESERRFRALVEQAAVGVAEIEMATGRFLTVNRRLCEMVGRTEEEMLVTNSLAITPPEDLHLHENKMAMLLAGEIGHYNLEKRFVRKDGTIIWVNITVSPLWKSGEKPGRNMIVVEDITDRRRAEEALKESEERYRTILEEMNDAYFEVDLAGNFTFVNDAVCRLIGYSKDELIGNNFRVQMAKEDLETVYKAYNKVYRTGKPEREIYYKAITKDGATGFAEMTGFPLQNQKGDIIGFRGLGRDITERRQAEEEIKALAITDALTGLYNRRGFITLAERQIKGANRSQRPMLLTFIDCDRLKWINDTLGHEEGDKALIDTANLLRRTFRESDIIARLGGDEFAVLSIDAADMDLEDFSRRLQRHIDEFNETELKSYKLSMSWGTAIYSPESPLTLDRLISTADSLMYAQKKIKSSQRM